MYFRTYTTMVVALLMTSFLSAQTFYTEDFSGGALPDGWTSVDLTSVAGEEVVFEWTDDPFTGFGQGDFMASSTLNGYMKANSDGRAIGAAPAVDHTTELTTSAIDCSGRDNVFVQFETQIGWFVVDTEMSAILRVSTDNATWTDYTIFTGIEQNDWSNNPEIVSIDVSDVAANQSTVYVQWQWTASWEYIWALDDVALTTEDFPVPPNDMRVNTFAAIAPNAATPASQVEPFGFIADIENVGSAAQTDIDLIISIEDGSGTEVYTDVVNYDEVGVDSLAENVVFANEFTPSAMPESYTGTYSLSYDSPDEDAFPENNELSFAFEVTDSLFAKETGATTTTRPADDVNYQWGNVFYVNNATDAEGNQLFARYITFAVSSATPARVEGNSVNVFLYTWDGTTDNNDGRTITQDALSFTAINEYTFTGDEGGNLITVVVDEENAIPLEANTYYIPTIQYNTDDPSEEFFMQASEALDYAAMNFGSEELAHPRYASALDVSNEGTLDLNGFGYDIVPLIRLSIGENPILVATEEPQLPAGAVSIFPNPAQEKAMVDIQLEEAANGTLQVIDIQGKVVQNFFLDANKEQRMELNVTQLPNGTYTLRVQTDLGVSNKKLVVQH